MDSLRASANLRCHFGTREPDLRQSNRRLGSPRSHAPAYHVGEAIACHRVAQQLHSVRAWLKCHHCEATLARCTPPSRECSDVYLGGTRGVSSCANAA